MLYLSGIIITFFLALILWSKKGKSLGDRILASWLSVIGLHLLFFYMFITGYAYQYPFILGISVPFPLFHGPFLYLYVLTETRINRFLPKFWLHFIPPGIAYGFLAPFFNLSNEDKIAVFKNAGAGWEVYSKVMLVALLISGFTYVALSLLELNRYRQRISNEFSDIEKINLHWLRYLIFGILAIWLIIAFMGRDEMIFGAVVIFVMLLGYFGIKHVGVFTYRLVLANNGGRHALPGYTAAHDQFLLPDPEPAGHDPLNIEANEAEPEIESIEADSEKDDTDFISGESRAKYERSGLQQEVAEKIHQDLVELMQKEKSFRESELTLAGLASRLKVHPHNLSQVINSFENKSFYDYINLLRIEEFKQIVHLPRNRQFTLLSLAFEAGFNSKTAFNRNFKKITGQSPSAYLKEANIQLAGEAA